MNKKTILVIILLLSIILSSCGVKKQHSTIKISDNSKEKFSKAEELWYQQKLSNAKKFLEEILEEEPKYNEANRKLAFIEYYYYQNYDKAIEIMKDTVKNQPKESVNHSLLGKIYYLNCEYDQAIKSFRKALDLDDNNRDAYYYIAKSYLELSDTKKSKDFLIKLLKVEPFDLKANTLLHLLYVKDQNYEKAYQVWQKSNLDNIGDKSLGFYDKWNQLYSITLKVKSGNINYEFGKLYSQLSLYDEAKLEFEKALEQDSDNKGIVRKLDEVSRFINFRDKLKSLYFDYYVKCSLVDESYELDFLVTNLMYEEEKIYKEMLELFPDIKYNPIDFSAWYYSLNDKIQEKFGVIINKYELEGNVGCNFGYVVGDSIEAFSQWGDEAQIRVTLLKNMEINGFVPWYMNMEISGGWSNDFGTVVVLDSKYYLARELWKEAITIEEQNSKIKEKQNLHKDIYNRPSKEVFYSDLLSYKFMLKDVVDLIDKFKKDFDSQSDLKAFVQEYIAYKGIVPITTHHEAQHDIDMKYYDYERWEKEYRAKLTELVYGEMPFLSLYGFMQLDMKNEETAYGKAHNKIFKDIGNYIYNHKDAYPMIDTTKNILAQLDKLSKDDIRNITISIFEEEYID